MGNALSLPAGPEDGRGDPYADSDNLYWLEHAVEDALVLEWCHEQLSLIFATPGKVNQLSNLYLYLIVQVKLSKINWAQARQNFNDASARWLESDEYKTEKRYKPAMTLDFAAYYLHKRTDTMS